MTLVCPHCSAPVRLPAGIKPGRYTPRCPKCSTGFALEVPATGDPTARPLPAKAPPPGLEATTPPPAASRPADANTTAAYLPGGAGLPADASFSVSPEALAPSRPAPAPRPTAPAPAGDRTAVLPHAGPDTTQAHLPAGPAAASFAVAGDALERTIAHGSPEDDSTPDGPPPAPGEAVDIPSSLGGYRVVRELGRGGMGAVYLARQLSLDREVALKVLSAEWAADPGYLARFTREAYAAAQLVHHNIVQIYDIGSDAGLHFFSMEFVAGRSLGDLVKKDGPLEPELAVGYVLQAARGLKFAHDRGMIHRDIKPDNLLLNDLGVVKVADLGLVKLPGRDEVQAPGPGAVTKAGQSHIARVSNAELTSVHVAMGTPAYMAPEQARDAANVDHRADLYSLGCTLYVLVTGRPPFTGTSAFEVMTKHASEPVVPPEAVVKHVPRELSALILKALAKRPEDRYADAGAMIAALEGWLKAHAPDRFRPGDEHVAALEGFVRQFRAASLADPRAYAPLAIFGGVLLVAVLLLLLGQLSLCFLAGTFAAATAFGLFVARGLSGGSYLFTRARAFLLGSSPTDWATAGVGVLVLAVVLWLVGLFFPAAFVAMLGLGVGAGLHFTLDRPLAARRRPAIEGAEQLLKRLRLRGMDEGAVRRFVADYAGSHWEEFFEALFGYEAKREARATLAAEGVHRPKFAAWRDTLADGIAAREENWRAARERRHLQRIERAALKARGVDDAAAREQAELAAELMVEGAAAIKREVPPPAAEATNPARPVNVRAMVQAAHQPSTGRRPRRPSDPLAVPKLLLGGRARFLAGAAVLIVALMRMNAAGLFAVAGGGWTGWLERLGAADLPFWAGPAAAGAGLVLVLSAFRRGGPVWLGSVPGAALLLFGPSFLPGVFGVISGPHLAAGLGAGLGLFGLTAASRPRRRAG